MRGSQSLKTPLTLTLSPPFQGGFRGIGHVVGTEAISYSYFGAETQMRYSLQVVAREKRPSNIRPQHTP